MRNCGNGVTVLSQLRSCTVGTWWPGSAKSGAGNAEVTEPKTRGFHGSNIREFSMNHWCVSPISFSDGKLYDAYVLYPKPQKESQRQDVDTLVLKLLPEVLERQCRYKLFIFGRDEFPGQGTF